VVAALKLVFLDYLTRLFESTPVAAEAQEVRALAVNLLNRLNLDVIVTSRKCIRVTTNEAKALATVDMFPPAWTENTKHFLRNLVGVGPKVLSLLADTIYHANCGIPMDCHAEQNGASHELFPFYCSPATRAAVMGGFVPISDHIRANEVPASINQLLSQTPEMTVQAKVKFIKGLLRVAEAHGQADSMLRYLFHCL
jgi:hypothetical protein